MTSLVMMHLNSEMTSLVLITGVFELTAVTLLLQIELPHKLPSTVDTFLQRNFGFLIYPPGRMIFAAFLGGLCASIRGGYVHSFGATMGIVMIVSSILEFAIFQWPRRDGYTHQPTETERAVDSYGGIDHSAG